MPSVTNTTFAEAKTGVFLDVEECPIPEDLDPKSVYQNIRSALANKGYHGEVSIMAFGDRNQIPGYYESAGIKIFPEGDKHARIIAMMIELSDTNLNNLMVISRNGMELADTLTAFKNDGHNVLFANALHGPRVCQCSYEMKSYELATEMWVWESLACGGDPLVKTKRDAEMSNEEEGDVKDFKRTFSSYVCS